MNSKPKNWIITASREHVKQGVKGGFAQACHGKSSPLKKMNTGDHVIYYSSKPYFKSKEKCQQFTAIGRVKSNEIYTFRMSTDFCPHRINIHFFSSSDISILPLINDLHFIENKQRWGYPFRKGILQINDHDFKLISNKMRHDPQY